MAATVNPNQLPIAESPEPARRDFRQEVTDRIINMLENGVAPWQKPWNPAEASLGMPMNPTTGKTYRGGNAIHLMATGLRRDYGDPRTRCFICEPLSEGRTSARQTRVVQEQGRHFACGHGNGDSVGTQLFRRRQ